MTKPIAWTIAGTDPSGGAGIQADLKTMHDLGVHGCSVITAVIAQNTQRVAMIEFTSDKMLREQLGVLREDVPPAALKIGMLGTAAAVTQVAQFLEQIDAFVVCDPVMASSTGAALLEPAARNLMAHELLPQVDLLTPNLAESEVLAEQEIRTPDDMEEAARRILNRGVKSVLVKGGHMQGPFSQDFWTDGTHGAWLTSVKHDAADTHGSGCTLSSAIAACRALGFGELDAVVIAKAYVNQGIRKGGGIRSGHGHVGHEGWPAHPEDLPWITRTAEEGQERGSFPDCGPTPLGFYPLVDRASRLEELLALGVGTAQLRIKDLEGKALEDEIRQGVAMARKADFRLFINDHWEPALRLGAYGVHLGQEDIDSADVEALADAGVRVGMSAYTYAELARAWALQPSYIALGAVFPTGSKDVDHPPLGLDGFARMRRLCATPAVAIGGISLEQAGALLSAGADGIAVISDIAGTGDVTERVRSWLDLFAGSHPGTTSAGGETTNRH